MSDYIPVEIQLEIMKRLPLKSLLHFRSVSKTWKALIDSSHFIADYKGQLQHVIVTYDNQVERNFALFVDDDSFPQHSVSPTLPPLVKKLRCPHPFGCSHGLLCLYSGFRDGPFSGKDVALIWNISIQKAVAVVVPNVAHGTMYQTHLDFGVCGKTLDPKIVKITDISLRADIKSISIPDTLPWQVEVFALSEGAWRRPYSSTLPRTSIRFCSSHVLIDGFLYWIVVDNVTVDGGLMDRNLIISFDITSEEFKEVNLPDSLAQLDHNNLFIHELRESLIVIECDVDLDNPVSVVWMMEDGVSKSFTKLFNIYQPAESQLFEVMGSTKRGELIMEVLEHPYIELDDAPLVVYEPNSQHFKSLGIIGISASFSVYRYEERLLLLDHPDDIVYNKGERYIFKPEN